LFNQQFLITTAVINWIGGKSDSRIESSLKRIYTDRENFKIRLAQEAMLLEIQILQNEMLKDIGIQVAHDVASPLTALRTMVEYGNFEPAMRNLIEQTVHRTVSVVGDLRRSYAEIAFEAKQEEVDLQARLQKIIDEKRLLSKVKISIFGSIRGAFILGQSTLIDRVFSNLIDNAVQSSKDLNHEILVLCESNNEECSITIQDRGVGISAEQIKYLGTKGYTRGKIGGSGYGLYHAFSYMKSISGQIKIKSMPGEGTSVQLIFLIGK
jgi:signal transduction histidine kinase